jgi:hypothetical protein
MGFVYDGRDLGMGGTSSALAGAGRVAWNPAAAYDPDGLLRGESWALSCATFTRYEDGEPGVALSGVIFAPATLVMAVVSGGAWAPVFPCYPVTYLAAIWESQEVDGLSGFYVASTPFKRESDYDALDVWGLPVHVSLEERAGKTGGGVAWGSGHVALGAGVYVTYADVEAEASNGDWVDDNVVGVMANVGAIVRIPASDEASFSIGAAYHTGGGLSRCDTTDDPEWTSPNLIGDHAYWAWDGMDADNDGVLEGWPSVLTAGAAFETESITLALECSRIDWRKAPYGEELPELTAVTVGFGVVIDDIVLDIAVEQGKSTNVVLSFRGGF